MVSILACRCSCNTVEEEICVLNPSIALAENPGVQGCEYAPASFDAGEFSTVEDSPSPSVPAACTVTSRPTGDRGLKAYSAALHQPVRGTALRRGDVLILVTENKREFVPCTLTLFPTGFSISSRERDGFSVSWSPFVVVQACRLHNIQADKVASGLGLFKLSIFTHSAAYFFATQGEHAETERARWVADIARALRSLTISLLPDIKLSVNPVEGAAWTSTRILAGYMLMWDNSDVVSVYCELHSHWGTSAAFVGYEDNYCDARILHIPLDLTTAVSERVGIDCSNFSINDHHFSVRSCAERALWLRAISNIKVKLRHKASNPTVEELQTYRDAVVESLKGMRVPDVGAKDNALLPQRATKLATRQLPDFGLDAELEAQLGAETPNRSGSPSSTVFQIARAKSFCGDSAGPAPMMGEEDFQGPQSGPFSVLPPNGPLMPRCHSPIRESEAWWKPGHEPQDAQQAEDSSQVPTPRVGNVPDVELVAGQLNALVRLGALANDRDEESYYPIFLGGGHVHL